MIPTLDFDIIMSDNNLDEIVSPCDGRARGRMRAEDVRSLTRPRLYALDIERARRHHLECVRAHTRSSSYTLEFVHARARKRLRLRARDSAGSS